MASLVLTDSSQLTSDSQHLGSYQPSHELMLRFYAYFKQASEGPCTAARPAFWEVVKKMKWDAWNKLGNMPREEAMNNYVEELKKVSKIGYYGYLLA
nr:unnamed protein product [Timema californicum]